MNIYPLAPCIRLIDQRTRPQSYAQGQNIQNGGLQNVNGGLQNGHMTINGNITPQMNGHMTPTQINSQHNINSNNSTMKKKAHFQNQNSQGQVIPMPAGLHPAHEKCLLKLRQLIVRYS